MSWSSAGTLQQDLPHLCAIASRSDGESEAEGSMAN